MLSISKLKCYTSNTITFTFTAPRGYVVIYLPLLPMLLWFITFALYFNFVFGVQLHDIENLGMNLSSPKKRVIYWLYHIL